MAKRGWWAGVVILAACGSATAAELDYELRAGVAYSDNVLRVPVDEMDTAAALAGLRLRGAKESGRFQYELSGDFSYLEYFDSAVDGELLGEAYAESSYEILPQVLSWNLGSSFRQSRETLLRPAAPGNRDDIFSASTGPTLRARIGDAFEAEFDARYALATYSERDFDNETVGGQLVLARALSGRSLIGIGGSFSDVTYESDLGGQSLDFERSEIFLRFRAEGVRTRLELDAGYSRVEGASVEDSGLMLRLEATRRLTPFISGFVSWRQEYPQSEAPAFAPYGATEGAGGGDVSVLSGAPRVARSGEVGLRLERPRTRAEFGFSKREETDLLGLFGDRTFDQFRLNVTRSLTPRSQIAFFAGHSRESLSGAGVDANETTGGLELSLAFGRNLGLDLRVQHAKRSSDDPAGEFSELSGGLFLRWGRVTPGGRVLSVTPTAFLQRGNP
jgi:hypothetical protein